MSPLLIKSDTTSIIISSISLSSIIFACTAEKQPSVKVQGKV